MLWGDAAYKQRLGGRARELHTLVMRRSPAVRFAPAYIGVVGAFRWLDFKARVKPFIRRHPAA
jgi:hypothetical protein